jgi:hypothetical protein
MAIESLESRSDSNENSVNHIVTYSLSSGVWKSLVGKYATMIHAKT